MTKRVCNESKSSIKIDESQGLADKHHKNKYLQSCSKNFRKFEKSKKFKPQKCHFCAFLRLFLLF